MPITTHRELYANKLLHILETQPRISVTNLQKLTGIPKTSVWDTMKWIEKNYEAKATFTQKTKTNSKHVNTHKGDRWIGGNSRSLI